MRVAGTRLGTSSAAYVVLEDLLVVAGLVAALAFVPARLDHRAAAALALLLLVWVKAAFFWCGLYDFRHLVGRVTFWRRVLVGLAVVAAGAWLGSQPLQEGDLALAAFLAAFVPTVIVGRLAFEYLSRREAFRRRLLFVGIGDEAQRTAREILDHRSRAFELVGFLGERPEEQAWRIGGRPVLGTYADLERVVSEQRIAGVVVAVADRRRQFPLEALLRLRLRGVQIVEETSIHEEIAGRVPVEALRPSWLIFSDGFSNTGLRDITKRIFDVVVASVGLLLSAPVALLAAVAIRLESRGPVIFRQTRVGQGGREFTLYKFRSMRADAEAGGRPRWAQTNDPRVTRVGRFLRKTRIDEIPQMWNVLRGTMSFVGPRPERPFFVEQLRKRIPFYDQRHALKPGITGWAQVRFRYGSDETDATVKLRHDMFYVKHHSILFDLRILLDTVKVVFRPTLAR